VTSPQTRAAGITVITGAGRGIGRALALRLASHGAAVVAAARTRADLESLAGLAPRVTAMVADVASGADVEALAAAADARGALVAWVNNAAVVDPQPLTELGVEAFDAVLAVNLRGAFLGCRAALPRLAANGGGVILNIGSLSGLPFVEKFPGNLAYNVSKAGLHALSEAVALEGRALGVRCLTLAPGAVDTAMLRRAAPGLRAGVTPEAVAEVAAFLLSEAAAPLSGTTVPMFTNLGTDG
jgi:NAD(P)-dependent dehydrogenase (short-subunit alcohol dehydrogenase family)